MKELSVEEKAKAYDEALENARQEYNTTENVERKQWLEGLFPELVESEDEKTRKALISFLKSPFVNENITDEKVAPWLAWLEKQGELVNSLSKGLDNAHERIDELIQKNNKLCIKLEQKPAWTEEDEKILKDILVDVKFEGYNNDMLANSYKKINWLKSLKDRVQSKQKLNEHDNYVINKVLDWATFVNPTSSIFEKLPKKQFIESLKSLKQRI